MSRPGHLTGQCLCGAVRWRATASPFRSVICHCADCRAATGAAASGYLGFAKAHIAWEGTRAFHRTLPGTTRGTCPHCSAPLSYMSTRWPGELYLHAATLDDPSAFRPEAHLHWAERLPGPVRPDDLLRHDGRAPTVLASHRPPSGPPTANPSH
ncbi:MAG: GFA family protein [Pseudomonadota bacterium]